MRRIAGVVVEAAWALLLLAVGPEAGAVVVVMGTGMRVYVPCIDRGNKGGGEREGNKGKEGMCCRVWSKRMK